VVDLVLKLSKNPSATKFVRRNAQKIIWDTETMARTWVGHWEWARGKSDVLNAVVIMESCQACEGDLLMLADGYHCLSCGHYDIDLGESANRESPGDLLG
jgi:hypothetical protein